jgi:hypothetical protein
VDFAEHVARLFDRQSPGFRLRLQARRGYSASHERLVYVLTREDSDDILASLDVSGGEVTDVRWLAALRPAQQQGLLERLERALADAALADAAENDTALPDAPSSLQPLIEALERLGREAYGVNLRRPRPSRASKRSPIWRPRSKTSPSRSRRRPEALALRLEDEGRGLAAAVEVLRDPDVLAFDSVDDLLDKLWSALESEVPLSTVRRRQGGLVVESAAIGGTPEAPALLVREKGRGTRYRLRSVSVEVGPCKDDVCSVVAKEGELRSGAEVHHLVLSCTIRSPSSSTRCARRRSCSRTSASLLFLAGALIDTQRCQGKEQAAALRAFEQAKATTTRRGACSSPARPPSRPSASTRDAADRHRRGAHRPELRRRPAEHRARQAAGHADDAAVLEETDHGPLRRLGEHCRWPRAARTRCGRCRR